MNKIKSWYNNWFNEDYLNLYAHRTLKEAKFHVDFVEKALELKGSEKVLDVGCGIGRHSIAFADKSYEVVGVDLSHILLEKAKEQVNPGLPVEFIEGDIREKADIGPFDLVISMFTSFGYDEDDAVNSELLSVIRRCLRVNGQFFLDYLHPYRSIQSLVPIEIRRVKDEDVEIKRSVHGDMVVKEIHFPGRSYQERVKLYTREQIESMLRSNGFEVVSVWNDYKGNPWKEKGDRQLFRSKKII